MSELHRTSKDFTKEERSRLLEQYRNSGLGYQDFAKEHNILPATLKNWKWLSEMPPGSRVQRTPVERKKIVEAFLSAQSTGMTAQEFAKVWGVSTCTLTDWLTRYEQFGSEGLMNARARKAGDKRVGSKIPEAVQQEIIKIKKDDPSFGIRKVKDWMFRFRGLRVSAGSIQKTIKAEGLSSAKRPLKKKKSSDRVRRFERSKPMQMWQSDITQFTMGPSSMRVYLTVFMDDHSRYIVSWRLMSRQTSDLVMDAFKDGVVRFGKPQEVLTDQGRQYFAWRGKSDFEKSLEHEGIKHVVSRAHHPQTLGKCERFWETVVNEFWTRAKPQDLEEARIRLKLFIDHYNHHRPHQGLDGEVPADRFFGVAKEVRDVIEKSVEQNALAMSIGELPKVPAFLIGQVGDQRIAFHGTSGSFYLTHENLSGGDKNGHIDEPGSGASTKPPITGNPETGSQSAGAGIKNEVPGDLNPGALGKGIDGGAGACPAGVAGADGVLDGSFDEEAGDGVVDDKASEVLAVIDTSSSWNDGGSAHAAAP